MTVAKLPIEPKKAISLYEEFKKFAFKGNVVDLTVGVILGGAFGKIADSLVKDIIMPTLNMILPSKQEYVKWAIIWDGKSIPYGHFLGEIVNFLIVSMALYLFIVKVPGIIIHTKKEEGTPLLTKDQELLVEIRDLLKK